ncbi:MAG: O-antigen ligase family protein [Bacteroides sp.]|nr:O-antigen ligase family protein [Bacteroides sp.]
MDTTRLKRKTFPATALVNLMLCIGLFLIVFGLLTDNPLITVLSIFAPIGLIIIGYGFVNPRYTYILYIIYAYFFIYIMRFLHKNGLSIGQDILLIYMVSTLLLTILNRKSSFFIRNAVNGLTICYSIWILFLLFQMLHKGTDSEGIIRGFRTLVVGNLTLYIVVSLMSNTCKILKTVLILLGILTIIAFAKCLYQKFVGFDQGEKIFLYAQMAYKTHILNYGIRYFSYFSDAGNFGPHMGAMATIFSIVSFYTKNKKLKIFFIIVAISGLVAMFMAGTRSAIVVPFGGLALYCLLCRNIKFFTTTALIGILSFSFLAFTEIGQDNTFIRRMRTVIRPTEDASFNVRQENKILIADYLKNKPLGVGIYQSIPYYWSNRDGTYTKGTLPPDSYFVDIWIQHGIVGLCIHIGMYACIILWGSYLVFFKIKNNILRQILACFLGTVFGILLNGYAGECITQPPTNLLIPALLAFVMNGPYIDKQLSKENNNYIL